jgi:hypothetical protein
MRTLRTQCHTEASFLAPADNDDFDLLVRGSLRHDSWKVQNVIDFLAVHSRYDVADLDASWFGSSDFINIFNQHASGRFQGQCAAVMSLVTRRNLTPSRSPDKLGTANVYISCIMTVDTMPSSVDVIEKWTLFGR